MVTTNKFNLGITKVDDEETPYFPFNFHILAFELTINEFSGFDLVQDACIKCCQYLFASLVFYNMLRKMKVNHNFNYL